MGIRGEGWQKCHPAATHTSIGLFLIEFCGGFDMEKWIILSEPYNNYAVSDLGQIKNVKTGRILSQHLRPNDGYLQVTLWQNGKGKSFPVHRLVALNFLKNDNDSNIVNHINGIKVDNRLENLEWCSHSENNYHAVHLKLVKAIPVKVIDLADSKEYIFDSISQAAAYLNADPRDLSRALKRKNQFYSHYKISKI